MDKNTISISIGDDEIFFDDAPKDTKNDPVTVKVQLVPVTKTDFKFEFEALVTDKLVAKKYDDIAAHKRITEIWLERGLDKIDRIPLVRLKTYL